MGGGEELTFGGGSLLGGFFQVGEVSKFLDIGGGKFELHLFYRYLDIRTIWGN